MSKQLTLLEWGLLDKIDGLYGAYTAEVRDRQKPLLAKLVERGLLAKKIDETDDYLYTLTTKGLNAFMEAVIGCEK